MDAEGATTAEATPEPEADEGDAPADRKKGRKGRRKKKGRKSGRYISSTYGEEKAVDDGITFDLEDCEKRLVLP